MKFNKTTLFFLLPLLSLGAGGFMATKAVSGTEEKANSRPNVLYIMADDLTTQAISAYGDIYQDLAPTPNMDRLAKEGMLFNDVLCTNAICGPSRSAILTGKYSHLNGYYKNESGGRFNTDQWTFPAEFKKEGYQTALVGKWHLGTDPVGFDYYKFHANAGQQGTYWNPLYNENGKDVKEKGYATDLTTDFALNWLDGRQSENPFLMLLQFKAPHRPWEPNKQYEDLWDDVEFPYPATFDDNYAGRELTAGDTEMTMDYLSRRDMKLERPEGLEGREKIKWDFYGSKSGQIVQPKGMSDEEGRRWRYQRYIKDYLACVKSVDDNIGRVLDYLDANGLTENTIVVLTSDQGFYLGDHGFFDKRFIYEESLRMPFLVRYPGKVAAGGVNNDVISNVDFAPTLLDVAGIKQPKVGIQGKSFAKLLGGKTLKNWRQSMYYHYYEFPFWHHVQPHYGIRTERYTLAHFYYSVDQWELYDNLKDPDQINNLISDPAYQDVRQNLEKELEKLMRHYGNDLSLAEFREISDKDFGSIIIKPEHEENVEDIINGNKK